MIYNNQKNINNIINIIYKKDLNNNIINHYLYINFLLNIYSTSDILKCQDIINNYYAYANENNIKYNVYININNLQYKNIRPLNYKDLKNQYSINKENTE